MEINKDLYMKCPECNNNLIKDKQKRYQNLLEHVFEPNDEPCEKDTYVCKNKSCQLNTKTFWDEFGSIYCDTSNSEWCHNNAIDPYNTKTHNRKGTEAINSCFYDSKKKECKENRGFRKLRNTLITRKIYLSSSITTKYDKRSNIKEKIMYSFGVWLSDIRGYGWKEYINLEYFRYMILKYSYHPYPWVRYSIKKYLNKNLVSGK